MFESPRNRCLRRFFRNGKTVIVPIDHGIAIPVPQMPESAGLVDSLSPFADGFVVNFGLARAFRDNLHGRGVCLRVDAYNARVDDAPGSGATGLWDSEFAFELQCHAVMSMLFPWHAREADMIDFNARLVRSSFRSEIPVIIESLPAGLGQTAHYTVDKVAFAARMAAELGADVVKTVYPPGASAEGFRKVVESCFVPLIVLGGAAMGDDRALLTMVSNAMKAGAVGIAIGRNVWEHKQPAAILGAMSRIVHEGIDAEAALASMMP